MIYDSILDTIGNTPVVSCIGSPPKHVTMYVKVEVVQPAALGQGPARDRDHRGRRAARHAQAGPDRGRGDVGQHRHRARDGVRARRAIRSSRRWSETFSVERRKIMRALGAKVILTPAAERGTRHGAARRESSPRSTAGSSRASSRTRRTPRTTDRPRAPRSCADFAGKRLDYCVTGWGTGGTLTGAGEMHQAARGPR